MNTLDDDINGHLLNSSIDNFMMIGIIIMCMIPSFGFMWMWYFILSTNGYLTLFTMMCGISFGFIIFLLILVLLVITMRQHTIIGNQKIIYQSLQDKYKKD